VYNLSGEIIKTFEDELSLTGGWNIIAQWDGKNSAGNVVGRGIYFLYIKVEGTDKTMRRLYVVK